MMTSFVDVVLNDEDLELPAELVENEEIFKTVINYQTWQNLSQNDKAHLKKFLPSFSVNSPRLEDDTLRLIFSEDRNFKHGNPVATLYRNIKAGCCSPGIIKQLKKCRKLKYKDYKLKEKQRYRNLLQEILISRQRILDQLARHGPGQPIRTNRPESANVSGGSFDEKVRKKYQKIIKEVKIECEDNSISSDEEDDGQFSEHVSLPFHLQEHHPSYRHPIHAGLSRVFPPSVPGSRYDLSPHKSPAGHSFEAGDQGYREMLENHRKRRICNEAHPELDVSTISLADIIMRANPNKKGNKKSKKVKKIKKGRDEKIKIKKKHRPALPPLTQEDVYRIKQESAAKLNFEREEIISEEKIEEHFETSSANDEDDDAKCFFTLLRGYFIERPDLIRSESELMEHVAVWESSTSAAHLPWTNEQRHWSHLVTNALHYLAGEGNPLPDFIPLVRHNEETNEWKWTGIGKDDERLLIPLCNIWLSSFRKPEESNAAPVVEEPQMLPQNVEQQKTDFVVRPSTDHEKAVFQLQEKKRYENPHKPFVYRMHGFTSTVGPVKGVFNKDTGSSKAREHALLVSNRPAYVTILSLVRDAVARLPNGEGTRAEVCQLLKDSLFINPEATDSQIHAVVSGALDRLHAEKDPCVKYDTTRKLWVYLHRVRSVQEFERIHQASAAAAMAKKQLNQKQKTSSKKRSAQESIEFVEDSMKMKGKTSKKAGDKLKKSSKKGKISSPSHSEKLDPYDQGDIVSSPPSSPLQSSFHTDFLLQKEELIDGSNQYSDRMPYFTSVQGTKPELRLPNAVPLKITLPRGAVGSLSPSAMTLQMSRSSNHKGLIDADHEIRNEQSESSGHLIMEHDSSEFLPRMDSSFDDTF